MLPTGLCNAAVRGGSFGPMLISSSGQRYLSSCFIDIVLIPIPNYFLLFVALPLILVHSDKTTSVVRSDSRWNKTGKWIYYLLTLALLLMNILEIVRLALSQSGVGLLPFFLAGVLGLIFLAALRRRQTAQGRNTTRITLALLAYWPLSE